MSKPHKPLNLWFYVFLSAIPIIGYYPIWKLKKIRKILAVNIGIIIGCYLISFIIIKLGFIGSSLPIVSATPASIIIDGILVYHWVKDYNKNLDIKV